MRRGGCWLCRARGLERRCGLESGINMRGGGCGGERRAEKRDEEIRDEREYKLSGEGCNH